MKGEGSPKARGTPERTVLGKARIQHRHTHPNVPPAPGIWVFPPSVFIFIIESLSWRDAELKPLSPREEKKSHLKELEVSQSTLNKQVPVPLRPLLFYIGGGGRWCVRVCV